MPSDYLLCVTPMNFGSPERPGTTNSGNGGTVLVTLTNAVTAAQQFYRIQQLN